MSASCSAIKPNGERCQRSAEGPRGYCWAHDPANAEQRRRQASKAARSKPSTEIRDLKKQLEVLADDVLEGRVERGVAVVVNQILNTRARLIEIERKVKETEELEERLARLEATQQKGGSRWGA